MDNPTKNIEHLATRKDLLPVTQAVDAETYKHVTEGLKRSLEEGYWYYDIDFGSPMYQPLTEGQKFTLAKALTKQGWHYTEVCANQEPIQLRVCLADSAYYSDLD